MSVGGSLTFSLGYERWWQFLHFFVTRRRLDPDHSEALMAKMPLLIASLTIQCRLNVMNEVQLSPEDMCDAARTCHVGLRVKTRRRILVS